MWRPYSNILRSPHGGHKLNIDLSMGLETVGLVRDGSIWNHRSGLQAGSPHGSKA